jgi:hypothetical protein
VAVYGSAAVSLSVINQSCNLPASHEAFACVLSAVDELLDQHLAIDAEASTFWNSRHQLSCSTHDEDSLWNPTIDSA